MLKSNLQKKTIGDLLENIKKDAVTQVDLSDPSAFDFNLRVQLISGIPGFDCIESMLKIDATQAAMIVTSGKVKGYPDTKSLVIYDNINKTFHKFEEIHINYGSESGDLQLVHADSSRLITLRKNYNAKGFDSNGLQKYKQELLIHDVSRKTKFRSIYLGPLSVIDYQKYGDNALLVQRGNEYYLLDLNLSSICDITQAKKLTLNIPININNVNVQHGFLKDKYGFLVNGFVFITTREYCKVPAVHNNRTFFTEKLVREEEEIYCLVQSSQSFQLLSKNTYTDEHPNPRQDYSYPKNSQYYLRTHVDYDLLYYKENRVQREPQAISVTKCCKESGKTLDRIDLSKVEQGFVDSYVSDRYYVLSIKHQYTNKLEFYIWDHLTAILVDKFSLEGKFKNSYFASNNKFFIVIESDRRGETHTQVYVSDFSRQTKNQLVFDQPGILCSDSYFIDKQYLMFLTKNAKSSEKYACHTIDINNERIYSTYDCMEFENINQFTIQSGYHCTYEIKELFSLKGENDSIEVIPYGKAKRHDKPKNGLGNFIFALTPKFLTIEIDQILNQLKLNLSVQTLDLSNCQLSPDNLSNLIDLLKRNPRIHTVNLQNTGIHEKSHEKFSQFLKTTKIVILLPGNFYPPSLLPSLIQEDSGKTIPPESSHTADSKPLNHSEDAKTESKVKESSPIPQLPTLVQVDCESKLELLETIGRGGFGIVYKGIWEKKHVAVKMLIDNNVSEDALQEMEKEARLIIKASSPYIVNILGMAKNPHGLILELMACSLYDAIHPKERGITIHWDWKTSQRFQIAYDVSAGLAYLHLLRIVHRDLKSLNILLHKINNVWHAKITDFGMAKVKIETQSKTTTIGPQGTWAWMPPELIKNSPYTVQSDIFSLAIVFWEIAALKTPYQDVQALMMIPILVMNGKREFIPKDCPDAYKNLIEDCWKLEPEERLKSEEVKNRVIHAANLSGLGLFRITPENHHEDIPMISEQLSEATMIH